MKDEWRKKYQKISEKPEVGGFQVLTAFNANIDRTIKFEDADWDLDVKPENLDSVKTWEDVEKVLKFAVENGKNLEVDASSLKEKPENGTPSIGGQAGIMANFLSGLNGSVTFYTPLLSQELADMIDEKVLHPYFDKDFSLKNVRDASNTDRTKENIIIEFAEPKSGRLILSDKLRGFGPYFRSGIEDNIALIDQNIEGALFSGFQNITGNREAKIEKAWQQLSKVNSRTHIELADSDREILKLIVHELLPQANSLGLDENEALEISDLIGKDFSDQLHVGEAFDLSRELIEDRDLERVHLHTYRYHLVVAAGDYTPELEDIRNGMLFGEVSAIKSAEIGKIPCSDDFDGLSFDNKHVRNLDELEEFQDFFNLEGFTETGTAEIDGYKVAAIPAVIHEEPKRLVGMGDLISSGAFIYELSREL